MLQELKQFLYGGGMRTSFVLDPEANLIEIGSWGKGE